MKYFMDKNTLFSYSILSKKNPYKEINENIFSFLHNNFSKSPNNIYKFPIRKFNSNKKILIKRKNTSLKGINSTKKNNNIRALIENLRHDKYISYNFINNSKGPLHSFHKNINNSLNYNQRNSNNSFNNLKSYSSQKNIFKSNSDKYKINRNNRLKINKFISENTKIGNLNHFSFINYLKSPRSNISKFSSIPQTPRTSSYIKFKRNNNSKISSSPQTPRTPSYIRFKRNKLKLDCDSLSFNNSSKKRTRSRSAFSLKISDSNNNKLKMNKAKTIKKKKGPEIKLSQAQRKFHQYINFQRISSQVRSFEDSNSFYVDDKKIKSNLISPTKFQRTKFVKRIKSASKSNNFYTKYLPYELDNLKILKHERKKLKKRAKSHYQYIRDFKLKKVLKKSDNLSKRLNYSKKFIKNLNFRLRIDRLRRIVNCVVPYEHKVKEIDVQFKDEAIDYQKNIGEFCIYKGNGIFKSHLSTILRGDKIINNEINLKKNMINL